MAPVALLKFLPVLAVPVLMALFFAWFSVVCKFRARAMRDLAIKWGLQYIDSPTSNWFSRSHAKISPPLPVWFSESCRPHHGSRIRQVWNVIEGRQSNVSLLIFDSIIGEGRGVYCTFVACETDHNPFGTDIKPDRLIQSGGWTAVYRVRFLQIPWTMSINRIDDHVNKLRVGSVSAPSC
jgi:hypothetical protein